MSLDELPPLKHLLLLCCTPRVGSSVLASELVKIRVLGNASEHFHLNKIGSLKSADELDLYVHENLLPSRRSRHAFSVCLMYPHIQKIRSLAEEVNPIDLVTKCFAAPEVHLVRITRRDKLQQAISLVRARQTGAWDSRNSEKKTPVFDRHAIQKAIDKLNADEELWLETIEMSSLSLDTTLIYEDDLEDQEDRFRSVELLLQLFGLTDSDHMSKLKARPAHLQRQADHLNREWAEKFLADD